jgi:dihydroorotate dehydrogenase (NAD+) catalytic subunit
MSAEDALEFMIAGATAVGVGTANFINPKTSLEIIKGIEIYLRKKGIKDINRLKGRFLI